MPIILVPSTRTTITLARTVQWAQSFGAWRSLTVGTNSEPAITSANIIRQTILGAPFCWPWNRNSLTFTTTPYTQDYSVAASDFGFIEKASFQSIASITNTALTSNVATYTAANSFTVGEYISITGCSDSTFNITSQPITTASSTQFTVAITHANIASAAMTGTALIVRNTDGSSGLSEISNVVNVLGGGAEIGQPTSISPQEDDNNGNITFRLLPVPDERYRVTVIYQDRVTSLISATTDFWAPIPDHYSYVYQTGFLALMLAYFQDARWIQFNQKFVGGLLGAADGLSQEQKNIFQATWLNSIAEQQSRGLSTHSGAGGRQT